LVPTLPGLAARCRFPAGHSPPERSPSAEGTVTGKLHFGSPGTIIGAVNMKPPQDINIHIPVAIAVLPDLNLIEKAVLNRIHERPDCSNGGLAMLTGMSLRGIEAALARLRTLGLIRSRGHGRARRLMLTFPVEHHVECGENVNAEHHTECGKDQNEDAHMECGVAAKGECHSTGDNQADDLKSMKFLDEEPLALVSCLLAGDFNQARANHDRIRQWYSALCEQAPDFRTQANEFVQRYVDWVFVVDACRIELNTLPSHERGQLAKLLARASPERLVAIRQQIEAAKARGAPVDLSRLLEG